MRTYYNMSANHGRGFDGASQVPQRDIQAINIMGALDIENQMHTVTAASYTTPQVVLFVALHNCTDPVGRALLYRISDRLPMPVKEMSDKPVKSLTCCCCGSGLKGRQWWNRDTGFGLCNGCIAFVGIKDGEDSHMDYGHRGVHWGLQAEGIL